MAFFPMEMPGIMIDLVPMNELSPIMTGLISLNSLFRLIPFAMATLETE